ncbi:MAG: DUF393 domain-containing protein [Gammaproteobacteria bacterium]|nr:DUF393 domain-containing protein [Pseudomonadales bacterium]MCP5348699.1 DUF393 domain-containing protein [Pseudomonadales bacterium]
MKITMFYDSSCPLCVAEINQLRSLDRNGALRFVDIHASDFLARWPHIDPLAANRKLHAQCADGTMLYGLDVTVAVWASVGRHRWLKLLRLPGIRWFADLGYRFFARHRATLSLLLTGRRHCTADSGCDAGQPARSRSGRS